MRQIDTERLLALVRRYERQEQEYRRLSARYKSAERRWDRTADRLAATLRAAADQDDMHLAVIHGPRVYLSTRVAGAGGDRNLDVIDCVVTLPRPDLGHAEGGSPDVQAH